MYILPLFSRRSGRETNFLKLLWCIYKHVYCMIVQHKAKAANYRVIRGVLIF